MYEQLDRPGAKLSLTGGGRCNLTNSLPDAILMERFGREGRFMQAALRAMNAEGLRGFMRSLGIETFSPDGLHVYPRSESAPAVRDALLRACRIAAVGIRTGCAVEHISVQRGAVTGIETPAGPVPAERVLIATGGRSYEALGGTGSGYEFARALGHAMVPPVPALVPLVTREKWPALLAGVGLRDVALRMEGGRGATGSHRGDLLFTHRGVSGPAVLDLSGDVAEQLERGEAVRVIVDLEPDVSAVEWRRGFSEARRTRGAQTVSKWLAGRRPAALAQTLCRLAAVPPDLPVARATDHHVRELGRLVKGLPLSIRATEGFDHAMVTRGGVSLRSVRPETLESRLVRGLYFAGEILDLDGPCGGYNLQWAFSSGNLAGMSAATADGRPVSF